MTDPPWAGRFDLMTALCNLVTTDVELQDAAPPGVGGAVLNRLLGLSAGVMAPTYAGVAAAA
jgi:hypothetical protein